MSLLEELEKRPFYAILDGRKVVPVKDVMEMAPWYEEPSNRIVRQVNLSRRHHIRVSTVFLAINHGFGKRDLWFETMIFGGGVDGYQMRYETWDEAERGHERAVFRARQARWNLGESNSRRARIIMMHDMRKSIAKLRMK